MESNDYMQLAELLFKDVTQTPADMETRFPRRDLKEGARVTRFAPSPTGFMHIGNLFTAFVSERTAHISGGVYFLRIEDTDKKREVEGAVDAVLSSLASFGMKIDEGVCGEKDEKGNYGPYFQQQRREIYHVFAKSLVEQGLAYPCFCTHEEIEALRNRQEEQKITPGYYGEYARCRNLSLDGIKEKLNAGMPYVLRLRSPGREDGKVTFDDMIKGKIEMPENIKDDVLLKSDGIPTYHFAHAVDDHLMGVTHVVRGDEWISSAPLHLQLFRLLGFKPPKYVHVSPLMKEEPSEEANDGKRKRKLSKRKDPEAAVTFYFQQGYPAASVREYLLTLANSNFEDWRRANLTAPQDEFPFNLKKMSSSGALFDLVKFEDVSKNVISRMTADEVFNGVCDWAKQYDKEFYTRITENEDFSRGIFAIDRDVPKPRKDIAKWSDAVEFTKLFFERSESFEMPENISQNDIAAILKKYAEIYNENADKNEWFGAMKEMCEPLGFCPDVKQFKKDPGDYKGHVGDVSGIIRMAVTGKKNTPDLWAIMKLLGKDEVIARLNSVK